MRKTLIASALAATFSLPAVGYAQTAPAPAAAPASPHTLTANIGLYSSYRFRGIDQTFGKPALQGGVDYAHSSGFYAGNWNSNVNSGAGYPNGNLEMDFYGGWKGAWGDWGLDVGAIYYYYPGTDAPVAAPITNARTTSVNTGSVDNKEVYLGVSWKFLSLKYYHAVDDYFGVPHTSGSGYIDLSANYDLGDGWGVNGHIGHLNFKNYHNGRSNGDYTDWKLGVTKDISGWVFGAAYVGTNAKGSCTPNGAALVQPYCFGNNWTGATSTKNAGRDTLVISVSRTF